MTTLWSVSTDQGASLDAKEFVGVLTAHHERLIGTWQTFSAEQWSHPSRNTRWSVHDTARHVADVMEAGCAAVFGEAPPFSIEGFDPRTTPETWMSASIADSPARTVERFAESARRLRDRVGERMAAGDTSTGATVYGPAHWSVMIVHVFWDSWLHERDMALPLGFGAELTAAEQRLAALYGLLMATVPAKLMGKPMAVTAEFAGPAGCTVVAKHESGRCSGVVTPSAQTELNGELCALVDSLSGRGTPLEELVSGAPEMVGSFAKFMAG